MSLSSASDSSTTAGGGTTAVVAAVSCEVGCLVTIGVSGGADGSKLRRLSERCDETTDGERASGGPLSTNSGVGGSTIGVCGWIV